MAQNLIHKAVQKVAVDYCRLSIVRNPDGFLARPEVVYALNRDFGLQVVKGDNLALRIHYELDYKRQTAGRFLYLCDDLAHLVPDMAAAAFVTDFDVSDLFPLFAYKDILRGLSLEVLTILSERTGLRRIGMTNCVRLVEEAQEEAERQRQTSAAAFAETLGAVKPDWTRHPAETLAAISRIMIDAIRHGAYAGIDPQLQKLNSDFQRWVDSSYFGMLNSNPLLHPRSVNNILPHLQANHTPDDRVALVVVDGLSYWQYEVLEQYLSKEGISVRAATTLAWIPAITMLSRQAIFRGDVPRQDYKQNPVNERKLWTDYWTHRGLPPSAVQYLSDRDEFAINEGVRRLAYVTVEMDEKMHSSTDYSDLLSLTDNWCPRITEKLRLLRQLGYRIYLTTDHGSVLSHGWQPISQVETVFLYKDGSRGMRHLIYNDPQRKDAFERAHGGEVDLLSRDNWLAARTDFCFAREGQQVITHGGSHFLEVVIPFVTIN